MKLKTFILCFVLTSANLLAQHNDAFLKGVSFIELGEFEEAIEQLDHAMAENKAHYYKGIALYKVGHFQDAISEFAIYLKSDYTPETLFWLAKCEARNENFSSSIKYIQEYLKKSLFANLKDFIDDSEFETLIQSPTWQDFSAGLVLSAEKEVLSEINYEMKGGNTDKALQLIDLNFNLNEISHMLKAVVYNSDNLFELEVYEWEQALALSPDNVEYLEKQGNSFYKIQQYDKAISNYEKCLKSSPELFEVRKALSEAYFLKGNYAEAKKQIDVYLTYFANDDEALLLSSKINLVFGDKQQSLKEINKLFKSKNDIKPEWYYTRGEIYLETGAYKYASKDFSMYLDVIPDNPEANLNMGNSQKKMGLDESACFYWKRAFRYGSYEALEYLEKYCK